MTTAVEKLRSSHLRQTQLELMGDDVDLRHLYLALNHKDLDIVSAVTDVNVERTMQGASTVTVEVEDRDRVLLRSGRLSARNDTEIDGLFFRLASVEKSGSSLTLTFEDREIAVLRLYNKPVKQTLSTSRKKITRAQFVQRLIREPKEVKIRSYIPELNKVQPVTRTGDAPSQSSGAVANRAFGIPKVNDLTVKGIPMTEEQRRVANVVLDTGAGLILPRKELVMAMMAAIQESVIKNLIGGDLDSVGVFQQRLSQGWPASRDISRDATAFYNALTAYLSSNPNAQYWVAVQAVQRSGNGQLYAQWRTEAERIVTTYGIIDGTAASANAQWNVTSADTGDYEFYRGRPPTTKQAAWGKESSWDCIQRLAAEVNWRAFFVSGVFYFISEDALLKSKPIAVIDENTDGVEAIDGSYSEGTKSANLTITCRMSKWAAPPGSVVQIRNMGPWNGRWLVNDVRRSLFNTQGTITLKKKQPRLPEPGGSNIAGTAGSTWGGTPQGQDPGTPVHFDTPGGMVQPVPRGHNNHIIGGEHPTLGLPGYPAFDFGADAGAPIVAVESGTIFRLSGHPPEEGPTLGVHGPFGWSVYLAGQSGARYYYTHMGTRTVSVGQAVVAGDVIGTIGDYAKWGGSNHTHVGVNVDNTKNGHPDCNDLASAPLA